MKKLLKILIVLFLLIFIFSLAALIFESCQGKKEIENFKEVLLIATAPEEENEGSIEIAAEEEKATAPEINLEALKKENPDCAAWIYIEDTNINYPVMHTAEEKEKYLYKNFYGNKSKAGTPFIDSRCTLESDNIIVYAHNMMNGTMFAHLKKYLDKSFYNSHKTVYLYTDSGLKEYEIFAVVKGNVDDNWYSFINNAPDTLIEETKNKSVYNTKIKADSSSKFITLSTCYGSDDKGRLFVIAKESS